MINGRDVRFKSPREASAYGVGMVHQHFKLVKPFTVAENILLANPRKGYAAGLASIEAEIQTHAETLGMEIDPDRPVATLSIAEQQRVEIIKTLIAGARILILDEPTAVLTDQEAERLLTNMRDFARRGATIVLVTHRLGDVKAFADRVTVMRGGRTVATVDPTSVSASELTALTVGSSLASPQREQVETRDHRLVVTNLKCARSDGHVTLHDASFFVRAGEIYGIAGVGGNGQPELAAALTGMTPPLSGSIELASQAGAQFDEVTAASPRQLRARGLAVIPADRQSLALAGSLSIVENYTLGQVSAGRYGSWAWVNRARMRADTTQAIKDFDIQGVRNLSQKAALLSGGNAQKLVIAREFAHSVSVIIAHSPSRGLDARACAAVHSRLLAARREGAAVLLISEDLDEILTLSDRIGVISRGRIVAEFDAPVDRHQVGRAMVDHA
jgi:ABC-type uncharacterized transport system ATPase subunit